MYQSAAAIARDIAALIHPSTRLNVSDAAKKYLKVKAKSGGVAEWSADLTPYMLEPMDCLYSRQYEAVIFVGPAQSGKTAGLLFGGITHGITCQNADMMIVQTTKQTATDFERQDLSWTLRHSPDLKQRQAAGSRNDNVFVKTFKAGNNLFLVWPTVSNLSGKAMKMMLLTDYDRMDPIAGEGSVFELARKRTTTYLSQGMTLAESSPSGEMTEPQWKASAANPHEAPPSKSQILSLFNDGDRRRWYVQCPECGDYYMPPHDESGLYFPVNQDLFGVTQAQLVSPAKYVCQANGCMIDTSQKRDMNASGLWLKEGQCIVNGTIEGEGKNSRIASFWFPGIFAAYADPQRLAERFLAGLRKYDLNGEEDTLQTVVNVDFGAPYLSRRKLSEYSSDDYRKRAEPVAEKQVHEGVRFLIAVVDVQGWGFSVAVVGYGLYSERWLIDRYEIRVSNRHDGSQQLTMRPAVFQDDWKKITTDVLDKTYPLADGSGRHMSMLITASDSGGEEGVTEKAYSYWRELRKAKRNREFMLVKGETPKPHQIKPKVRKSHPENVSGKKRGADAKGEIPLWLLNTTMLKDTLSGDLKKEQPGPRYIHFPSWLPESVYKELTVEHRDPQTGWIKQKGKKNELWDQLCYAEAALSAKLKEAKLKDELDWDNPPDWALPWTNNSKIISQDAKPMPKPDKPNAQPSQQNDWLPTQQDWLQ